MKLDCRFTLLRKRLGESKPKANCIQLVLTGVLCLCLSGRAFSETSRLPVHRFQVSCDLSLDDQGHVIDQEASHAPFSQALIGLTDFAKIHEGQAVYIEIAVEASNSAGVCEMFDDHLMELLPDDLAFDDVDRWFGASRVTEGNGTSEFLRLWSRTLTSNAGSSYAVLPDVADIPLDGLFVTQRFGYFYYLSGPLVIRHSGGNGFDAAFLFPIGNSHYFWKEVAEIRADSNRLKLSDSLSD